MNVSDRISYVHLVNIFELISNSIFFVVSISIMKEVQQAADFLEIPYLSKSIAASIQLTTDQNENIRNYATVSKRSLHQLDGDGCSTFNIHFVSVCQEKSGEMH